MAMVWVTGTLGYPLQVPRGPSKLSCYWMQLKFWKERGGVVLGLRRTCQENILQLSARWPTTLSLGMTGQGSQVSWLLPRRSHELLSPSILHGVPIMRLILQNGGWNLLPGFAGDPLSGSPEHPGSLWKEPATNTLLHVIPHPRASLPPARALPPDSAATAR